MLSWDVILMRYQILGCTMNRFYQTLRNFEKYHVLSYRIYDTNTMLISPSDVSKSEPLHFLVALVSRSNKLELIRLFTSRKSTSILSKWKLIAALHQLPQGYNEKSET